MVSPADIIQPLKSSGRENVKIKLNTNNIIAIKAFGPTGQKDILVQYTFSIQQKHCPDYCCVSP